jgi:serine/threonine protein kinase
MEINLYELKPYIQKYVNQFYSSSYKKEEEYSIKNVDIYYKLTKQYIDDAVLNRQLNHYNYNVKNISQNVSNTYPPLLKCITEKIDKNNFIGSGLYGSVYKISDDIAVKFASFASFQKEIKSCKNDVAKCVKEEVALSRKAGLLGVGPKIYDNFICKVKDDEYYSVIYMELIKGVPLETWLNGNPSTKEIKIVIDKIRLKKNLLHRNNIFHNDLHDENIMVITDGTLDIRIIDFGMALSSKTVLLKEKLYDNSSLNSIFERRKLIKPASELLLYYYVIYNLVKNKILFIRTTPLNTPLNTTLNT